MTSLFKGCSELSSINLSNFDTSHVTTFKDMFYGCSKLLSIDLTTFDTSRVKTISFMFYNCSNLEIINFGNIKTSSVENMKSLFKQCSKLSSINLSSFDTSHVTTFENMFSDCSKLKYLDLSNFKTPKLKNMENMFSNCEDLIYLNLYSFKLNFSIQKNNFFKGKNENLIYCLKDTFTKNYLFGNNSFSICLEPCSDEYNKRLNISYDGCVKSCLNNGFEYEYKNICYHICPNNTYPLFKNNIDIIYNSRECFEQTPQGYYFDKNEKNYKQCYENCKSCHGEGNETFNNCIECKENFSFDNNSENIINCYPICNYYYYFNESNIFHCTENLKCPDKYNKLIKNKNKCIDECKNDDKYKYEYNNSCFQNCPENTYSNESVNDFNCIFKMINIDTQRIITTSSPESQINNENQNITFNNNNLNFQNIKNETEILNIIKQNIDSIFDSENGKSKIIKGGDDIIFQITNAKNEKELLKNNSLNTQNLSILDLGTCEDKLKKAYIIL